jgi:uracil-DNA glycosylase
MTEKRDIQLEESWLNLLKPQFEQEYMLSLRKFLMTRKQHRAVIYPPGPQIFNALNSTPFDQVRVVILGQENSTPFDQVRVVILGQDPYHGPGQAHGLCFSVMPGVKTPPSLANIYREIQSDLGIDMPHHGCLQSWSEQGVLLLNAVLTVERGQAGSHQGKGWETFTDEVVRLLNDKTQGLVFMLWGSYAMKKGSMIDRKRHLVLTAPHPSPLSAHRGFLGCKHFSAANDYLEKQQKQPIDWSVNV